MIGWPFEASPTVVLASEKSSGPLKRFFKLCDRAVVGHHEAADNHIPWKSRDDVRMFHSSTEPALAKLRRKFLCLSLTGENNGEVDLPGFREVVSAVAHAAQYITILVFWKLRLHESPLHRKSRPYLPSCSNSFFPGELILL